ncbi:MAG: hypothetical protein KAX46_08945 [Chromatiaceae bacterium]|nr:hypothetical protein [Chromatiaceae bacterium]
MAAAELAIDLLRAHGARTASRLRALVDHLAAHYGEDPDQQFADALARAQRNVLDFTTDLPAGPGQE